MKISRVVGEDSEDAWNDKHLQYVYLWLTTNPRSPYYQAPVMVMTALNIAREAQGDFKKCFRRGNFQSYRFSVRIGLTYKLKMILSGVYEPEVIFRDSRNIVRKHKIHIATNPRPLPCPPFYRGSIKLTTKGMKVMLKQSDAVMATKHDPEGMERLRNPWGKL